MEKYVYKAMDTNGKTVKGKLIANGPDDLKAQVAKNGLYLSSFHVEKDASKNGKRMDLKSLITLCNQIASMLKAGLSIATALEMLYTRLESANAKKALAVMYESVQTGNSLSDAIKEMGDVFPPIMYNMVKSGELSGELDKTMKKLAEHFESENKLAKQIKSAMSYPLMILGIGIAVIVLMLTYVLPSFAQSMGDKMTPAALKLLAVGNWIGANGYLVLLIGGAAFVVIRVLLKNKQIREFADRLKLRLPKIGNLVKMVYTARFARNLAILYDNGIELIEAMQMCTQLVGNSEISVKMQGAIEKIRKGDTISNAMGQINCFDPLLISMIFVGEESGVLGEILNQTADYFDEESSYAISKIIGIINPAMLFLLVGSVGSILAICMSPIFSMYNVSVDEIAKIIVNHLSII